jgi:hypothetical protein
VHGNAVQFFHNFHIYLQIQIGINLRTTTSLINVKRGKSVLSGVVT